MRLLVESAIIFFGTLMAAALLALGGPAVMDLWTAQAMEPQAAPHGPASGHARVLEEATSARIGG